MPGRMQSEVEIENINENKVKIVRGDCAIVRPPTAHGRRRYRRETIHIYTI